MTKPVTLPNGKSWRLQKEALDYFKAMLARYTLGQRVTESADHADLSALLQVYDGVLPPGEAKAGMGIEYFSKQRNSGEGWSTDGFHVHRTDGSSVDFSYIQAVKVASAA
ncbi:DCL family protein [Rhizobacter sp. J219]|uniref:DCL family protein n=1 Tax=Rhizobacter sp. J219 TaxID=2898430 RepID=UPI002151D5D6|nr:DCL family protein [Rhizobacter sp. J219]MCR5882171.1 DCL family protein [Rhizobacter sp. J219]